MNERDLNLFKNMLMFAERINSRIKNVSLEQFLNDEEKQDIPLIRRYKYEYCLSGGYR